NTDVVTATVQLAAVPVGPALVQRLASFRPEAAAHLRQLTGTGAVRAALAYRPGADPPLTYDLTASLAGGAFSHAQPPLPLKPLAREVKEDYLPSGPVSGSLTFRRDGPHDWRKDWAVRPEGVRGRFHAFRYGLEDVRGTVEGHSGSDGEGAVTVHVVGRAGG